MVCAFLEHLIKGVLEVPFYVAVFLKVLDRRGWKTGPQDNFHCSCGCMAPVITIPQSIYVGYNMDDRRGGVR